MIRAKSFNQTESLGYTLKKSLSGEKMLTLDKLCENLEITVRPFAVCSVEAGERLMELLSKVVYEKFIKRRSDLISSPQCHL